MPAKGEDTIANTVTHFRRGRTSLSNSTKCSSDPTGTSELGMKPRRSTHKITARNRSMAVVLMARSSSADVTPPTEVEDVEPCSWGSMCCLACNSSRWFLVVCACLISAALRE